MPWNVNFGPLSITDKGVEVCPKMDFGVEVGNFLLNAGMGDLRDGLSLGAEGHLQQLFHGTGSSLDEFLRSLKAQDGVADEIINPLIRQSNKIISEVLRLVGMDMSGVHIEGVMRLSTGFGVHGAAALGWQDTEGYNMVGAGGTVSPPPAPALQKKIIQTATSPQVATGLSLGVSLFAGKKSNRELKVVIGAANFSINMKINSRSDMRAEGSTYEALSLLNEDSELDASAALDDPPHPAGSKGGGSASSGLGLSRWPFAS